MVAYLPDCLEGISLAHQFLAHCVFLQLSVSFWVLNFCVACLLFKFGLRIRHIWVIINQYWFLIGSHFILHSEKYKRTTASDTPLFGMCLMFIITFGFTACVQPLPSVCWVRIRSFRINIQWFGCDHEWLTTSKLNSPLIADCKCNFLQMMLPA